MAGAYSVCTSSAVSARGGGDLGPTSSARRRRRLREQLRVVQQRETVGAAQRRHGPAVPLLHGQQRREHVLGAVGGHRVVEPGDVAAGGPVRDPARLHGDDVRCLGGGLRRGVELAVRLVGRHHDDVDRDAGVGPHELLGQPLVGGQRPGERADVPPHQVAARRAGATAAAELGWPVQARQRRAAATSTPSRQSQRCASAIPRAAARRTLASSPVRRGANTLARSPVASTAGRTIPGVHRYDDETERLAQAVIDYARRRMRLDPVPLDGPRPYDELYAARRRDDHRRRGSAASAVLRLFDDVLSRACISVDHPRYLSFIPAAPTEAAIAVRPRRRRVVDLRRLVAGGRRRRLRREPGAALARRPRRAARRRRAGCSCRAARSGNLSALVAARHDAAARRDRGGLGRPGRWVVACSAEAHSSIAHAARVMDVDLLAVPVDADGRLTGAALARGARARRRRGRASSPSSRPAARPTSASSTTSPAIADVARRARAVAARRRRVRARGARRPVGAAHVRRHRARRLVHRRPAQVAVRAVRRLRAALPRPGARRGRRTPSRRATSTSSTPTRATGTRPTTRTTSPGGRAGCRSGSPSPRTGPQAYADAIETTLALARDGRRRDPGAVVRRAAARAGPVGGRVPAAGLDGVQYYDWSDRLMTANYAFVTPTSHDGGDGDPVRDRQPAHERGRHHRRSSTRWPRGAERSARPEPLSPTLVSRTPAWRNLAAHPTCNREVGGSTPPAGSPVVVAQRPQAGERPVYARRRSCAVASSPTGSSGLNTPCRCSSVNRPWMHW